MKYAVTMADHQYMVSAAREKLEILYFNSERFTHVSVRWQGDTPIAIWYFDTKRAEMKVINFAEALDLPVIADKVPKVPKPASEEEDNNDDESSCLLEPSGNEAE